MKYKLIVAVVDDGKTRKLIKAAREAGATGVTVVANARGEGATRTVGILGLEITGLLLVLLFLVEAPKARSVLETLARVGQFEQSSGRGIAFQIDVDDALGVRHQMKSPEDAKAQDH